MSGGKGLSEWERIFDFKIYRSTVITLALVLAAIISFFFLEPPIAYENGPLENLQVVQLIIGSYVAYLAGKTAADH